MPRRRPKRHFFSDHTRAAAFRWLLLTLVVASAVWVWHRAQQADAVARAAAIDSATTLSPSSPTPAAAPAPTASPRQDEPPPPIVSPSLAAIMPAISLPPSALTPTSTPPPIAVTSPPPGEVRSAPVTEGYPRPVRDAIEAQVALARRVISPGPIDGVMGGQTRTALEVFQRQQRLPRTGELDAATRETLELDAPALTRVTVTEAELAQLRPLARTWAGKAAQDMLAFETVLEMVAEKTFASQRLIQRLNPDVDWTRVRAGQSFLAPSAAYPPPTRKAAWVRIRLSQRTLEAFDANTNLLAHFPCSIAQRLEKRPVGTLRVTVLIPNPDYTFRPALFPESAEARAMDPSRYLMIQPGPNNPVGVAWIGLDRPGYGIHGTPVPEQVGRTESHGCFRLANWNAEYLLKLLSVGTPVQVEP